MMKKLTFMLVVLSYGLSAQCAVSGSAVMDVNSTSSFSASNESGSECLDCFQWRIIGDNLKLVETTKSQASVKATGLGSSIVMATNIKTGDQCYRPVDIVEKGEADPVPPKVTSNTETCDVHVNNFEVKKEALHKIILVPTGDILEDTYSWRVQYGNQEVVSSEITPKFNVSVSQPISSILLSVQSNTCTKNITKTYSEGYWTLY